MSPYGPWEPSHHDRQHHVIFDFSVFNRKGGVMQCMQMVRKYDVGGDYNFSK